MKVQHKTVEYREKFQLSALKSAKVNEEITLPFSSLRGWSVRFKKEENGKLYAGVQTTQNEDISHAVIRKVQYTVRSGSVDWKSGDQDFPEKSKKPNSGLSPSRGFLLAIPANQDCMGVEIGLIFNEHEKQVKAVNEYLDSHPDTIGELTKSDVDELRDLRQTEMKFYVNESESESVLTEMVDLYAMARLSHYIRGLCRFKRNQDPCT